MRHSTLTVSVVVLSVLLASMLLLLVIPASSEAETTPREMKKGAPDLEEGDFPPYSETVDSSSNENFEARGWETASAGTDIYGNDYKISKDGTGRAKYNFDIPAKDVYSVFAWWPIRNKVSSSVEIKVNTADGTRTETVDQSKDGGYWVPIGRYDLAKGDRDIVEISAGSGDETVIADAVAVVRGTSEFPAEPEKIGDNSETQASGETMFSAAGSKRIPQRRLIKRANSFRGTPYKYNTRCWWGMKTLDCSCFTRNVYKKWRKIPDHPGWQWYKVRKMSYKFRSKSKLKRGDLVFFDSTGNGRLRDAHDLVAIYAGNGQVIMASTYYGKVTWVKMKYLRGFYGGKRLRY